MAKLLVVEDELKTANTLKQGLEEKGYEVQLAHDGEAALGFARSKQFDLVILDVIIPRMNGFEVCRKLRESGWNVPVIMLTALGLTADKIKGFDSGSDDYLVKPFDFEELVARIKVALGRSQKVASTPNILRYADLEINLDTKEVKRGGRNVPLTAREYALLDYLFTNRHKVVSKEEISEKVWNLNFDTGTNVVEVYVSYLRNKLDKGFQKKLIHTRKGMGYIFREEE